MNGSIGKVIGVKWDFENQKRVKSILIEFSHGLEYQLERVTSKFQIFSKAYVYRSQFPITLAYGITIHKSQGLSLNSVLLDIGNNIFICGQSYVALSRLTTIDGLHIINFDPSQIKANPSAIEEYNRLRTKFRPDLGLIDESNRKNKKIRDRHWTISRGAKIAQEGVTDEKQNLKLTGFKKVASPAYILNALLTALLNVPLVSKMIMQVNSKEIKEIAKNYTKRKQDVDCESLLKVMEQTRGYILTMGCDLEIALQKLCEFESHLGNYFQIEVEETKKCQICDKVETETRKQNVIALALEKNERKIEFSLLLQRQFYLGNVIELNCQQCKGKTKGYRKIEIRNSPPLIFLALDENFNRTNVNGVSTAEIIINNSKYSTKTAIWKENTCYITYVKSSTTWITINGTEIKKGTWPRGSKNIRLLILEKRSK